MTSDELSQHTEQKLRGVLLIMTLAVVMSVVMFGLAVVFGVVL